MDCESKKGGKRGYPLPNFSRFGFSGNPDHNDTGISGIDTLDPTGKTAQTIRESLQDEEMAPHQSFAAVSGSFGSPPYLWRASNLLQR